MANPKFEVRLPPIMHAYLKDLAEIGYGKDKSAVARKFIEIAVMDVVEKGLVDKRNASDLPDEN